MDISNAGPPIWDRVVWDEFKAAHGRWPFSAEERPPSFENCPSWAYELMGLREPPITVMNPGMAVSGPAGMDDLAVWRS